MRRLLVQDPIPAASAARLVAVFALNVVVISAILLRFGIVEVWPAVAALASGYALALLAIVLALVAFVRIWRSADPGGGRAFVGFALASLLLVPPLAYGARALVTPQLNDVTTDLDDPPIFLAARGERTRGANPVAYDPAMAARQREAYPTLFPLVADAAPDDVRKLVLDLIKERRWRLVADIPLTVPDPDERVPVRSPGGRIEAVAKSPLLGFEDDIAIRLSDQDGQTRVDMRSASRYGSLDFGANAERVSTFLEDLRQRSLVPTQTSE
jgi:uncharacterized protein DUF1499